MVSVLCGTISSPLEAVTFPDSWAHGGSRAVGRGDVGLAPLSAPHMTHASSLNCRDPSFLHSKMGGLAPAS